MNLKDSLVFALLGSAMEVLPRALPGLFPHPPGDIMSCRALWLQLMGAVQMSLGAAVLTATWIVPAARRHWSAPAQALPGAVRAAGRMGLGS